MSPAARRGVVMQACPRVLSELQVLRPHALPPASLAVVLGPGLALLWSIWLAAWPAWRTVVPPRVTPATFSTSRGNIPSDLLAQRDRGVSLPRAAPG